VPGIELHVNRVWNGLRMGQPPLAAPHHQSHFTLEPSLGVTPFWELGAYLQSALLGDGSFEYAGVKLRSKFVTPPDWHPHLRMGINMEISFVPRDFDESGQGAELRPIIAWENPEWLFAVNPIIEVGLGRPGWNEGPGFAPALMALYKWREKLAFGIEYYADFGPFARGFLPGSVQEHYFFEAVDLLCIRNLELNLALGEGLTAASNSLLVKMIIGYVWERVATLPPEPIAHSL
jgi:hypothetical protein